MEIEFYSIGIDKIILAKILQKETGICPVTLKDLYALSPTEVRQFFIKCTRKSHKFLFFTHLPNICHIIYIYIFFRTCVVAMMLMRLR